MWTPPTDMSRKGPRPRRMRLVMTRVTANVTTKAISIQKTAPESGITGYAPVAAPTALRSRTAHTMMITPNTIAYAPTSQSSVINAAPGEARSTTPNSTLTMPAASIQPQPSLPRLRIMNDSTTSAMPLTMLQNAMTKRIASTVTPGQAKAMTPASTETTPCTTCQTQWGSSLRCRIPTASAVMPSRI